MQTGAALCGPVPHGGDQAVRLGPGLRGGVDVGVAAGGLTYAQRGDARALGISAAARLPQAPDIPTFAEGGVANAESYTWHMIFAPAGTPAPVIQAVNAAFNRAAAEESHRGASWSTVAERALAAYVRS